MTIVICTWCCGDMKPVEGPAGPALVCVSCDERDADSEYQGKPVARRRARALSAG